MAKKNKIIYRISENSRTTGKFAFRAFVAILFVPFSILLFIPAAHAATINVTANTPAATVGVPLRVDVSLDTQGDDMNAIQGTLTFPTNLFSLQSVSDGNSIVSFWVDPPGETASGVVEFSGIVPGGFDGSASSVLGLVLNPIATGSGTVALSDFALLRNDGNGTPIPASTTAAMIMVSPAPSGTLPLPPTVSFVTPEAFTPVISQDPNVYGGKYFLAFSTTDNGSGIDHYEVLEVPTGRTVLATSSWQTATSPYLLQDQSLSSNIYVRAVDHAGNAIVVKVPARYPASSAAKTHRDLIGLCILASLIILLLLIIIFRRRRMLG